MERYDLSGIYIFDQFDGEERRQPTCIEDCTPHTRQKWLESQDKEALIKITNHLCETIHTIAEQFGIRVNQENEKE